MAKSGKSRFRRVALPFALALAGAAAVPAPALADDYDFELVITWQSFSYDKRFSCDPTGPLIGGGRLGPHPRPECGPWERINASMSVEGGSVVGPYRVRNIGTWDRPPRNWDRTENWSSDEYPDYPVFIGSSTAFLVRERPMCQTETYRWCRTGYAKNNNTVTVRGKYGDKITFGVHAQTTDGQEGCRLRNEYFWTKARVDLYNARNPRHTIMYATYEGDKETLCSVSFTSVAKHI